MLYQPTPGTEGPRRARTAAFRLPRALFERYRQWACDRADMERLRALDDRLLADMGIARSEIATLARAKRPGRGS